MSPRWNWDSPTPVSRQRVWPSPQNQGGHTRLQVRGWGSPNSDYWRKSLALSAYSVGHSIISFPMSITPPAQAADAHRAI